MSQYRYRIHTARTDRDCCNECDHLIRAGEKYVSLRGWNEDGETRFLNIHYENCWGRYGWQRDAINDRPKAGVVAV